jgi:stress-induced morphogen
MSDSVAERLEHAIQAALDDAEVEVRPGSAGHYSITVTSKAFAGLGMMESHRKVYAAIAPLMKGDGAPVHAVDSLKTIARA